MESVMGTTKTLIHRLLFWFTAILLVAMAMLVIYQVFTRYVLDSPAAFTEELVTYTLMWSAFAGGAYAFVDRKHMALVFFQDRFPAALKRGVKVGIDALILLFAVIVLVIGGLDLAIFAWGSNSALLGIPRGIAYLSAPVAGVLIVIIQVISLWEDVTGTELATRELVEDDSDPVPDDPAAPDDPAETPAAHPAPDDPAESDADDPEQTGGSIR